MIDFYDPRCKNGDMKKTLILLIAALTPLFIVGPTVAGETDGSHYVYLVLKDDGFPSRSFCRNLKPSDYRKHARYEWVNQSELWYAVGVSKKDVRKGVRKFLVRGCK